MRQNGMDTEKQVNIPSEEEPSPLLSLEQLAELDFIESMGHELPYLAKFMAWSYLVLALFHLFFVSEDVRGYLIATVLLSAAICSYISWYLYRCEKPTRTLLICVQLSFVFIVTTNVIFHMLLTKEVFQSTNIMMVLMLLAYLKLPLRYYSISLAIIAVVWVVAIIIIAEAGDPLVVHFAFAMLFGGVIATVISMAQYNLIARKTAELHARLVIEQQLHSANKKLEYKTQHDPLTGIGNRRKMSAQLNIMLKQAIEKQQYITLMFCDVDKFKVFNDRHGHLEGDEVLLGVAKILATNTRAENDVAARVGGDEFCLLVTNCDAIAARRVAAQICSQVRGLAVDDRSTTITIGSYSLIPDGDTSISNVLELADKALYQAKDSGRDGFLCTE
jgi:diguanylate cyclase (GGDEF)-like protein